MAKVKKWLSPYNSCDICNNPIRNKVPWFVDGKTIFKGMWGLLCPTCFEKYGCGLGCGLGQKYDGKSAILLEGGCKDIE
jgi:hypothetical protein